MTLLISHHRNKENQPSVANGTAHPRRHQNTAMNPYSQPLPFNQNERKARRSISAMTVKLTNPPPRPSNAKTATTMHGSSLDTIEEEEETSPTIRRILAATGCSSRQEFLSKRAAQAQVNTNELKAARNGSKAATAMNGAATNTNVATNGAKNRAKTTNATRANSTNGSKTTNPKKKARSKYFCLTP